MISKPSMPHGARWKKVLRKIAEVALIVIAVSVIWLWCVDTFIENADPYKAAPQGTQWTDVSTHRIAYQHTPAEGKMPMVLIGGTTAWSGVWEHTAEELKDSYDIYAIDLPPFGYSVVDDSHRYNLANQADLINGFIDSLGLKNVVLVAHSYGAGPSMEALLRAPERYSKFVLIDGAVHVDREGSPVAVVRNLFNISVLRYLLTSTAIHFPGFMKASLKYLVYDNASVTDYWVDVYEHPLSVENQSRKLSKWFYDFVFENGKGLSSDGINYKNLAVPVAILWGREDNLTPLSQGEYLHSIMLNSTLTVIDSMGHIPMIDDHKRFIEALNAVLMR